VDEDINIVKCKTNYTVHFGDGEKFTLSTDATVLKKEVERFEGPGGYEGLVLLAQTDF
jgi:phytoene desaturase (3,4-didehydrolycopene-forming)